jgi:hypothetical protein
MVRFSQSTECYFISVREGLAEHLGCSPLIGGVNDKVGNFIYVDSNLGSQAQPRKPSNRFSKRNL